MFDVGGGELLLIILVILLLFGPEKLPEFAKTINKGLRKVKQAQAQFQTQMDEIQKDINSTLDVDEKLPTANDFKPIPLSEQKIGAFDQMDMDKNFISTADVESKPEETDRTEQEDSSGEKTVEKVSTKKNIPNDEDKS